MPNALEMTTKSTKFVVNATAAPVTTPVPLPNERGTNTAVAGSTDARPLHGCTTDDDVLDCFGDDDDDDDGGVTRRVEDSQHLVAARALKLARAEAEAYADVQVSEGEGLASDRAGQSSVRSDISYHNHRNSMPTERMRLPFEDENAGGMVNNSKSLCFTDSVIFS